MLVAVEFDERRREDGLVPRSTMVVYQGHWWKWRLRVDGDFMVYRDFTT
jgi:hypothetical protein